VVRLLRVFYFDKGAPYYFQSAPFMAKLALFVGVGLLSI
jgi:putative membrane protein